MTNWIQMGKWLLVLGVVLTLLGVSFMLGGKVLRRAKLPWLGHLPGDIRIERRGFSCYFPLVSSILISLLLTGVLNIIVRLLKRQ